MLNTAVEILGLGGVVPLVAALIVALGVRRCFPSTLCERFPLALGMGVAFLIGYVLQPAFAGLVPTRHWHWLPYLGLGAAILGPLGATAGLLTPQRWLLYPLLALAAAWLLVPTWPALQPVRGLYVCLLASYFVLLMTLLERLPERLQGSLFPGLLSLAAAATTVLIAASTSLKIGQVAGIALFALLGCWIASLWGPAKAGIRGLIPSYAILVGGLAFVGSLEPDPPHFLLCLAPAAPLTLWAFTARPLSKLSGTTAVVSSIAAVLLPLIGIALWELWP